MITFLLFINSWFINTNYDNNFTNGYFVENIIAFTNSPNKDDLDEINDLYIKYCETVYLEATRRRKYTEKELSICSNFFNMKREQEMDYIKYMQNNRVLFEK